MPSSFHVLAKPVGPICNLDCKYCFYLEKEKLYPEKAASGPLARWAMPGDVLEAYVRQYIEGQDTPGVEFAFQGGEPTLLGVDYFRRVVELQHRYAGGKQINNSIQTNGVLLDDAWGEFLAEHRFLVGISIDGPRRLHDHYRVDKGGQPTFDRVMNGLACLKKHKVEFNTLTTVHRQNAPHALEVYRFLTDIGSRFLQFIPLVDRLTDQPDQDGLRLVAQDWDGRAQVSEWSVEPAAWGRFLCAIFDRWVRHDVGRVYVQMFDVALENWVGAPATLCLFRETCGSALALEHNGDFYSCDHFVYPGYKLGNVRNETLGDMAGSPAQLAFGLAKRDTLPRYCRECEVRFACHGECPKHRFARTPDGDEGLNYLCAGYKEFFRHVDPYMRFMAAELARERPPANVMAWTRQRDLAAASRNDPCPCGSGRKFKRCCGAACNA